MLFVGGMVPVVFSALAMNAVGKAAMEMVNEVRRQFREIPGIMEGTGTPEYAKCVDISTKAALREMLLPGILTIGFPIAIAFAPMMFGMTNMAIAEMLGGYMAGVTVSGVLWAIFQNNAGGAWDNAKKSFEAGIMINGEMTYKGSEAHMAAVTGDTVGDPFKDTSGPSMNILIKLTCLIGLVIAPILGNSNEASGMELTSDTTTKEVFMIDADGNKVILTEKQVYFIETGRSITENITSNNQTATVVEMVKNDNTNQVTANVTITRVVDGVEKTETKTFSGTEEEVRSQLKDVDGMKIKIKDKE